MQESNRTDGLDATVADHYNPESVYGQWCIFNIDQDSNSVASRNPADVG